MAQAYPFQSERPLLGTEKIEAPEPGYSDIAAASAELSAKQTPTVSAFRLGETALARIGDAPKMSAKELNDELNPPIPFTEPDTVDAAKIIVARQKREEQLQSILDRGPKGFWAGTTEFFSGLAPQVVDPVNILAGVTLGTARTALAARGVLGTFFGAAVTAEEATRRALPLAPVVNRLAIATAENAAAMAATEPLNLAARFETRNIEFGGADMTEAQKSRLDEEALQTIMNIGGGSLLSGALHVGGGVVVSKYKERFNKLNIKAKEQVADVASTQVETNKPVNVDDTIEHLSSEPSDVVVAVPEQAKSLNEMVGKSTFAEEPPAIADALSTQAKNADIDSISKEIGSHQEELKRMEELGFIKEKLEPINAEKIRSVIEKAFDLAVPCKRLHS